MIRTRFIDFDSRRNPKTSFYCVCCQKDVKPGQRHRLVYVGEGMEAIHPEDVAEYVANPDKSSINIGPFPMGLTCSKKLGLEWTVHPQDVVQP